MKTKLLYEQITYVRAFNYEEYRAFEPGTLKLEFDWLAKIWKEETEYLSKKSEIYLHPAYADIVLKGWNIVPFILEDLEKEPYFWLKALKDITNENPVIQEHEGNFNLMVNDWLDWGRKKQLL